MKITKTFSLFLWEEFERAKKPEFRLAEMLRNRIFNVAILFPPHFQKNHVRFRNGFFHQILDFLDAVNNQLRCQFVF